MASLKEIKSRISSVKSTQQLTKAMKMVAASKLRKAQRKIVDMRPFAKNFSELTDAFLATSEAEKNWYDKRKEEEHILFVTISGDRGLCGSFNASITRTFLRYIETHYQHQHEAGLVTIVPIGKKGYEYVKKHQHHFNGDYWTLLQQLSFDKTCELGDFLIHAFQCKKYDQIKIVYNEFKNVATQTVKVEDFLPLVSSDRAISLSNTDYIYQPTRQEVVEYLIPTSLKVQLYKAMLESSAAEHGARMTAMDQASDNASELLKELKLVYNHTRQAAITKEILEIVGGAEALKDT